MSCENREELIVEFEKLKANAKRTKSIFDKAESDYIEADFDLRTFLYNDKKIVRMDFLESDVRKGTLIYDFYGDKITIPSDVWQRYFKPRVIMRKSGTIFLKDVDFLYGIIDEKGL